MRYNQYQANNVPPTVHNSKVVKQLRAVFFIGRSRNTRIKNK